MRLRPLELAAALAIFFFAFAADTHASPTAQPDRAVRLGYATYQGYYNDTYDLNVWKGYVHWLYNKRQWQKSLADGGSFLSAASATQHRL